MSKSKVKAVKDSVELSTGKVVILRLKTEQFHQTVNELLNQIVSGVDIDADEISGLWATSSDLLAQINERWETTAP